MLMYNYFKHSRLDFTELYIQSMIFELLEAQLDQPLSGSPYTM